MKGVNGILLLAGVFAPLSFAYDNLSFEKNTTQSKTYPGSLDLYKAENAVDNIITTCMRTKPIGLNSEYKTVWWKVDLGGVYDINTVNILFKNYNENEKRQRGRFAGFSLYVSNSGEMEKSSLCYKDGPQLPPLNFTTTCNTSGRYVIFYNERLDKVTYPRGYETANVFTELCEVFVYGGRPIATVTYYEIDHEESPEVTNTMHINMDLEKSNFFLTTNSLGVFRSESRSILWRYVTPISLGMNLLFFFVVFTCLWGICTKRVFVFCKRQSCGKSGTLAGTKSPSEECSNYRELDVCGELIQYENTILHS